LLLLVVFIFFFFGRGEERESLTQKKNLFVIFWFFFRILSVRVTSGCVLGFLIIVLWGQGGNVHSYELIEETPVITPPTQFFVIHLLINTI
jgi:hypothetical protein